MKCQNCKRKFDIEDLILCVKDKLFCNNECFGIFIGKKEILNKIKKAKKGVEKGSQTEAVLDVLIQEIEEGLLK